MPNCDKAIALNNEYFERQKHGGDHFDFYVHKLLPEEMECAKKNGNFPKMTEAIDLLILLVGHSPEPLLQAIYAYNPAQILLVVNDFYPVSGSEAYLDGREFAKYMVIPLIESLCQSNDRQLDLLSPLPLESSDSARADSPQQVFQLLQQRLHTVIKPDMNIVLDITGGKKSTVAGAFLFAAFADLKISYVDFQYYDVDRRRPNGYSCQIDFLSNPYARFALKEWQQVKNLFDRSEFASAAERLKEMIADMHSFFVESQTMAAQDLQAAMLCYDAWLNGHFNKAAKLGRDLRKSRPHFQPPKIIEIFSDPDIWPHVEDADAPSLMATKLLDKGSALDKIATKEAFEAMVLYAYDECGKIPRIAGEMADYRSALLRSAAVNELLYRLRIEQLVSSEALCLVNEEHSHHSEWHGYRFTKKRQRRLTASQMEWILSAIPPGGCLQLPETSAKEKIFVGKKRSIAKPNLPVFAVDGIDCNTVRKLRNKSIHAVLPIPKRIALAAARLAELNWAEFERHWLADSMSILSRDDFNTLPSWEQLCDWCEVNFLPPLGSEKASYSIS